MAFSEILEMVVILMLSFKFEELNAHVIRMALLDYTVIIGCFGTSQQSSSILTFKN